MNDKGNERGEAQFEVNFVRFKTVDVMSLR